MSRHITRCKPEYQSALRPDLSEEGWYEPEDLKTLQQLFDGLWLVLRKQVFPWDVEASREMLAIQLFQSIPDAGSNPDQLKQEILTLWQIRQQEVKRSGSTRHTVMGSKTRLWATDLRFTAPSAPMTTRMHMIADRFVVEIARVYQDRSVPVG